MLLNEFHIELILIAYTYKDSNMIPVNIAIVVDFPAPLCPKRTVI